MKGILPLEMISLNKRNLLNGGFMKKTIFIIMLCGILVLGSIGLKKDKETKAEKVKDTYNKIVEYFGNEKVDRNNLAAYSFDEKNNIVIVTLIDNSKEKQKSFIEMVGVYPEYIRFEKGGPYTVFGLDFRISKRFHPPLSNLTIKRRIEQFTYQEI